MGLESISSVRIYPPIGIARVGNSEDEYFIGPEVPYPVPRPLGFYKDRKGHLKRQGALFRIYGYDADGKVVAELTAENADISWTVHVANKKAAWYDFDVALDIPEASTVESVRRNGAFEGAQRAELVIDPGERSISGKSAAPKPFDTGTFVGIPVYLGELRTDEAGRLLFLGGRGVSANYTGVKAPTTFANNDNWYDDTSDGPVHAEVKIGNKTFTADPAWVVTAPPNYGPDIVTPQTMYDVMYDTLAGMWLPSASSPKWKPSFRNDIMPLLQQMTDAQWVNEGFATTYGWKGAYDFSNKELLQRLSQAPGVNGEDTYRELRKQIFYQIRKPGAKVQQPLLWPPLYGDAFGNYNESPQTYFSITKTKYALFQKWEQGDFIDDYDTPPRHVTRLEEVPLALQPETLTQAALHWCMGGPFHPGCEMTWPMRQLSMYRAPFRLLERPKNTPEPDYGSVMNATIALSASGPLSCSGPGDITRWMAVPWQTDTASCRSGYSFTGNPYPDTYIPSFWPSRVPNNVLTQGQYERVIDTSLPMKERMEAFEHRVYWLRGLNYNGPYIPQITKMITVFGDLGVVEARKNPHPDGVFPETIYVESRPTVPVEEHVLLQAHVERATLGVSEEFTRARFGGGRGRRLGATENRQVIPAAGDTGEGLVTVSRPYLSRLEALARTSSGESVSILPKGSKN